jgi:hypothetical protein
MIKETPVNTNATKHSKESETTDDKDHFPQKEKKTEDKDHAWFSLVINVTSGMKLLSLLSLLSKKKEVFLTMH